MGEIFLILDKKKRLLDRFIFDKAEYEERLKIIYPESSFYIIKLKGKNEKELYKKFRDYSSLIMVHPKINNKKFFKQLGLYSNSRFKILKKAVRVAEKVHFGQKRHGGGDYIQEHVFPVALDLANYFFLQDKKIDESVICSAILHDVLEDSKDYDYTSFLKKEFGNRIYRNVELLTKKGEYFNDKKDKLNRDIIYFKNIKKAQKNVRLIKIADRYCNLLTLKEHPRIREYILETEKFIVPIAKETDLFYYYRIQNILNQLKNHLKKLKKSKLLNISNIVPLF